MNGTYRLGGLLIAAALIVTACAAATPSGAPSEQNSSVQMATTTPVDPTGAGETGTTAATNDSTSTIAVTDDGSCPEPDGAPWTSDVTATSVTLQEAGDGQAGVEAVVYPHPEYAGKPWSQWGQGILLDDGRFISAIGDHHGADGNSFVFSFDPENGTLTQIADVLQLTDHQSGDWGFGKVHAQMVEGTCGDVYLSTYWGSRRGLQFNDGYQGDLLFRIDPESETIDEVGLILAEHGVASMAATPAGDLIYSEAADPFGQKVGSFVVTDPETGAVVFEDPSAEHGGYRSIAVDAEGGAYITWNDNGLARYDPATNTLTPTDIQMPGSMLRAATEPAADGTIYAVTRDPGVFFSLGPDGTVTELGPARGYTTSMALAPSGDRFYYVPDAHGGAWEEGTPLIAVDTATGAEEVIVELNPLAERVLGLRLGGTYNVVADPSGERVFIGLNAGDPATRDTFGEVVLVVVTLP